MDTQRGQPASHGSCGVGECRHGVGGGGGREKEPFTWGDLSLAPRCPLSIQLQVSATVVLENSSLVPKLTRQGGSQHLPIPKRGSGCS